MRIQHEYDNTFSVATENSSFIHGTKTSNNKQMPKNSFSVKSYVKETVKCISYFNHRNDGRRKTEEE